MAVAVAVAVAVSGGGAVAVAVAGFTKRFFNHIQKDFLINVWCYTEPHGITSKHFAPQHVLRLVGSEKGLGFLSNSRWCWTVWIELRIHYKTIY